MKSEIEVKFLNVNHDEMRDKLRELGAECEQPTRLMRRVTIDNPLMKSKNAFLRVRDEGHKTTMTYKQFDSLSVNGAKEIEVTVSEFESTVKLLRETGLMQSSYQESKRETWRINDYEVVLDEWPWLKPYIEIEGESEAGLKNLATKLGLDWTDAVFGDVMVAYRAEYPYLGVNDTVGNVPEVKFNDPLPELLQPK